MHTIDYKIYDSRNRVKDFVFINGFNDPYQNHEDIFNHLSNKGFRVIAINMPGHGLTETIKELSFNAVVDIIRKVIAENHVHKPIISGYSMGGGIALKYAETYSGEIDSIVLLSPYCYKITNIFLLLLRCIRFIFNLKLHSFHNFSNKSKPPGKVNLIYSIKYLNIFANYTVDYRKFHDLPVRMLYLEKDEIIELNQLKTCLNNFSNANLEIIKDVTHDIYYLRHTKIVELSDKLVKSI